MLAMRVASSGGWARVGAEGAEGAERSTVIAPVCPIYAAGSAQITSRSRDSGRVEQRRLRRLVATASFDRSVAVTGDNLYGIVARRLATSEVSNHAATALFDTSSGRDAGQRVADDRLDL
jgi:hypothetical protein